MFAMAFSLKYFSAVIEENNFEVKRLFRLKIEIMNEFKVNFWRVFLGKFLRVFAFRWIEGVSRVKAVRLKEIIIWF